MRPVTAIQRGLPLLDMSERERRLIDFIAGQGRYRRWQIYSRATVPDALALQMNWKPRRVREAVASLKRRGWVRIWVDFNDRPTVMLTDALVDACEQALNRQRVRSACGQRNWYVYGFSDEDADAIYLEVTTNPEKCTSGKLSTNIRTEAHRIWQLRQDGHTPV